jgi:cytoskeletal protein CcmA (bactofilin family)
MFGKSQSETADNHRDSASVQRMPRSAAASSATSEASSISSGLSIIGKIVGDGALTIFGHVEGELRASTVVIAEGAKMVGEVSAEELTIGGQRTASNPRPRQLTATGKATAHQTVSVHELTLTDCPLCPFWVKSGRDAVKFRCPLYPRKRTFAHAIRMSALCQKQTFDVPARAAVPLSTLEWLYLLVDELIRADRCAGTMPLAKLF